MHRVILSIVMCAAVIGPAFAGSPAGPAQKDLPYADTIGGLLRALEYSGFPDMTKASVTLGIDFGKRTWTLRNIHEYDAQGNVILGQGRYGLCAELATYLYEKLKPLLSGRYDLKFAMATEAGFFPTYQSNHIILLMFDQVTRDAYLIDPSFHKYGRMEDLSDYQVLGVQDTLAFITDKSSDTSFQVDQAMPLLIRDDLLLSFAVTSVDGKFDKDNFLLAVAANQRHKFAGLDIVLVGRHNGRQEGFESKYLLEHVLKPEEIETLYNKLSDWLKQIR